MNLPEEKTKNVTHMAAANFIMLVFISEQLVIINEEEKMQQLRRPGKDWRHAMHSKRVSSSTVSRAGVMQNNNCLSQVLSKVCVSMGPEGLRMSCKYVLLSREFLFLHKT